VSAGGNPQDRKAGSWHDALAAIEAWWRDAGVDNVFEDTARDWLVASRQPAAPATGPSVAAASPPTAAPAETRIGGDPNRWPGDLAAFADWWLSEPTLGLAGDGRRVAPRGAPAVELMVLIAQPEAEDRARLLSGPQGRLLAAILAALGLAEEQAYVASVVPAHLGVIDWQALQAGGMGAVLAHHIALAAPKRLLVMGRQGISALLGHDPAQTTPPPPYFQHEAWQIPLACTASLDGLLERPARKARVWEMLLDWRGV
jgi:uracil-DNA glycosylase